MQKNEEKRPFLVKLKVYKKRTGFFLQAKRKEPVCYFFQKFSVVCECFQKRIRMKFKGKREKENKTLKNNRNKKYNENQGSENLTLSYKQRNGCLFTKKIVYY